MDILISIPRKIFGTRLWVSKYRRTLPRAWSDILDGKRRLLFIRLLSLLPHDEAMLHIIRRLLNLPKSRFFAIEPADIAAIAEHLDWMRLDPSTTPVLQRFNHKGHKFALPKPEFVGGSAYEFAQADDYYLEFLENADAPENLLRLVATLARPYSKPNFKATGDARNPLSTDPKIAEHGIELRANFFKDLDVAVVMATLRYFEGVKKEVYEMGVASGIFPKPKETKEGEEPTKSEKDALFGWWTAYRNVAKSQNKTEEEVWQMSLWRVLSVMIEEKIKADEAEKQLRQTGKNE